MAESYGRTNLLQENNYQYELQDVKDPQLFRDMFDYKTIPKIRFNHRHVPMHFPEDIWITDTTFRDGQQACAPFSTRQIVDLYRLLSELGGPKGIIRQSEFFVYSEKDRSALKMCQDLGLKYPEVTAWIRADKKDFALVKDLGVAETGILVSCSDYHIFNKMGLTRRQAVDKYLGIIADALSVGIRPRCHFEDITRADFYGFVVPFVIRLMELSEEAKIPVKIRMCDTLGYGVSFPGASLPRSVPGIVYGLRFFAGVPSEMLEWHGHNDFHKAVANSGTAWLYGACAVNGTMLGIGERTGNCPLEAMAIEYAQLKGTTDGMDLQAITRIAAYFEKELGFSIPDNMPFSGRNFNATKAGIHADGLMKDEEIYNIFDTGVILNRVPVVMVGAHSGGAGIACWINSYFKLAQELAVRKDAPIVLSMKSRIEDDYRDGRMSIYTNSELEQMIQEQDAVLYTRLAASSGGHV